MKVALLCLLCLELWQVAEPDFPSVFFRQPDQLIDLADPVDLDPSVRGGANASEVSNVKAAESLGDGSRGKKRVAAFMSTGVYSHDKMLNALLEKVLQDPDVHVEAFQVRVFEFNVSSSLPRLGSFGERLRYTTFGEASALGDSVIEWTQRTMWTAALPFDLPSLWHAPQTALGLHRIFQAHQAQCAAALRSADFLEPVFGSGPYDLVIVDYVLNECLLDLAAQLDAPDSPGPPPTLLVNFVMPTGYREVFGLPNVPSYAPEVLTGLPRSLSFAQRLRNVAELGLTQAMADSVYHLFHLERWASGLGRLVGRARGRAERRDYRQLIAGSLFYLNPLEEMLELPRPLTQRVKMVGTSVDVHNEDFGSFFDFQAELGIEEISPSGFILASFGSTVSCDRIPEHLLRAMLRVFGEVEETVVWTGFSRPERLEASAVPGNVHLRGWVPLRRMLGDPRLRLLVSHGGFNTLTESGFSVPLLFLPLHSDHKYWAARMRERGCGEVLEPYQNSEPAFRQALARLLSDYPEYKRRLGMLKGQQESLTKLHFLVPAANLKAFWTEYALRRGRGLQARPSYLGLRPDHPSRTYLVFFSLDLIAALVSATLCLAYFASFLSQLSYSPPQYSVKL